MLQLQCLTQNKENIQWAKTYSGRLEFWRRCVSHLVNQEKNGENEN